MKLPTHLTTSNARAALVDLSLNAVALCNAGANSRADIILYKRKETKSMPKTFEELMTGLEPDAAALVNKHIETLQTADKALISQLQTQVGELEKKVKAPAAGSETQASEDIFKNASPEIKAAFEKMQGQMQQLLDAQAESMVEKRYQLCKAIPVEETVLRDVLKSASPAVMSVLEKAATAITEGLMKAKGTDVSGTMKGTDADSAYATLEKSAKAIAAEQGITFEKAFGIACERDPGTYQSYVEGVQ